MLRLTLVEDASDSTLAELSPRCGGIGKAPPDPYESVTRAKRGQIALIGCAVPAAYTLTVNDNRRLRNATKAIHEGSDNLLVHVRVRRRVHAVPDHHK
jgi:hypothetical protein